MTVDKKIFIFLLWFSLSFWMESCKSNVLYVIIIFIRVTSASYTFFWWLQDTPGHLQANCELYFCDVIVLIRFLWFLRCAVIYCTIHVMCCNHWWPYPRWNDHLQLKSRKADFAKKFYSMQLYRSGEKPHFSWLVFIRCESRS